MKARTPHTALFIDDEEYRQKPLVEKWKDAYYNRRRSRESIRMNRRLGVAFFLFTAVSELWVMFAYLIPHALQGSDPMTVYWVKVFWAFVFVNALANWYFVRMYDSALQVTEEERQLQENLYREHCTQSAGGAAGGTGFCHSSVGKEQMKRVFCDVCRLYKPPRAHHCVVCQQCILKRDHHCFLTGVCIGFRNQRYFVFLTFYTAVASFGGLAVELKYLYDVCDAASSYTDYVLPLTIARWLAGSVETHFLVMVFHCYSLVWIGPMSAGFFTWQLYIICMGITSNEATKGKDVAFPKSTFQNFRSVFGHCWALNFLFPAQILFRQPGDGTLWHQAMLL